MGAGYWCGEDAELLNPHCPQCGVFVTRIGMKHEFFCMCGWKGNDPIPPEVIPSFEDEEWAVQARSIHD